MGGVIGLFLVGVVIVAFVAVVSAIGQSRRDATRVRNIVADKRNQGATQRQRIIKHIQEQNPGLDSSDISMMQTMNMMQMEQFVIDNDLHMQQNMMVEMHQHMHDPYLNPGLDAVVDHDYHGIPNGLGGESDFGHHSHDFGGHSDFGSHDSGGGFDGF